MNFNVCVSRFITSKASQSSIDIGDVKLLTLVEYQSLTPDAAEYLDNQDASQLEPIGIDGIATKLSSPSAPSEIQNGQERYGCKTGLGNEIDRDTCSFPLFFSNHSLSAIFANDQLEGKLVCSISRDESRPAFGSGDQSWFMDCLPHLRYAHALERHIRNDMIIGSDAASGRDSFLMIFRDDLLFEIVRSSENPELQRIQQQLLRNLHSSNTSNNWCELLAELIAELKSLPRHDAITVYPKGERHIELTAQSMAAYPNLHFMGGAEKFVLVKIRLKSDRSKRDLSKFARLYDLSTREVSVLESFFETFQLRATGRQLNIKYETVRWHMKRILEKSDSANQAELIFKVCHAG
ncbi:helix-turn-helix transcriptional regulator [Ponticaulis profundi]|uniref:Helix-turn-helix transcriptional regulator n=1 Tax=Ponticaulis profundi TaxID=2665222 RepID=A0ABW1SCU1_9PROT